MLTGVWSDIKIVSKDCWYMNRGGIAMHKRIQIGFIFLILMMISFTITSCVRPYPGSEVDNTQPIVNPIVTQPPTFVTSVPITIPAPTLETTEPSIPEPTPISTEPTAEPSIETIYTVVAGDTLFKIALEFDVSVEAIAAVNELPDIDSLEVGQQLIIPAPGTEIDTDIAGTDQDTEGGEEVGDADQSSEESQNNEESSTLQPTPEAAAGGVHIVQAGENLFRIGLRYGCSVQQLSSYNGITNPNRISVGMEIMIPDCN
jgi:LysM repeat protein